jgi:hypothetical protein
VLLLLLCFFSSSCLFCIDDISELHPVNANSGNGTIVGRVCADVSMDRFRSIPAIKSLHP